MSGLSSPDLPAPSGWLGLLGSWLRTWSRGVWQSSGERPCEAGGPVPNSSGSVRVLVADDNPVNLMVMSALLESRGLVPLLAADGAEAVALACELHLDLILMDLQLPVLDGLQATSAIRRFESTSSRPAVPVVAYSGTCPGEGVLAMHGLNGSLVKPCAVQDLEDCLVQWCPTYRAIPSLRSIAHDNGSRRAAPLNAGSASAALR